MPQKPAHPPVGYVVERFPSLSDTPLLDELLALEARGIPLHVFSLEPTAVPHYHHELPRLAASVSYVPGPRALKTVLRYNRALARAHRWRHPRTVVPAFFRGPRFHWHCLQAGWIAFQAERMGIGHLHAQRAGRAAAAARFASRMTGIPYSFLAESGDLYRHDVNDRDLAAKIKDARFVTTACDYNVTHLTDIAPQHAGKIRKVNRGINLERFTPTGNLAGAPFRMVCVASLVEKKGIPVLVKAARRLIERGCGEFQIDIVGTGPLAPHVQNVVRASGLKNHVRLVGAKRHHEIALWLQNANAFVLPSVMAADGDHDVVPTAIIEALASGLPVISTTVGGIPEVVKDGVNGLLAPPGDPDSLAFRMESLIRDGELYERLRLRARDSVAPRFSRERTAASLHETLEWAAANRPAPRGLAALWNRLRRKKDPEAWGARKTASETDPAKESAIARARSGASR